MRAAHTPYPQTIEKTSDQNRTCPVKNHLLVLKADLVNFRFIKPKAVTVAALCGYEQKSVLPRFLPCWRMSSTGAFP